MGRWQGCLSQLDQSPCCWDWHHIQNQDRNGPHMAAGLQRIYRNLKNTKNTWGDRYYTPSRSAPSSTSPMSPVPADDSSSNRESVLRSNAMFSMPLEGVLKRKEEHDLCSFPLPSVSKKGRNFISPWITCRACIQWGPYPAQGWTQWCPAHLRYPRSQANLNNTQHRNPDNTDRVSMQVSFKSNPE